MTIRTATSDDLAAIRALFYQLDTHAVQSQPQHFRRAERPDEYLLRLMEASKAWGKARGAQYLRLSVLPDNLGAQRFYARHGLVPQMVTMEGAL